MTRRLARLAGLAVAATVSLSACATSLSGLEFHKDNRLTITGPAENALVHVPVDLTWRMSDFTVAGVHRGPLSKHVGYFGVFLDHAPVRPGQTLAAVNNHVADCQHISACDTPTYLSGEGVYTTTREHLTLQTVPDIPGNNQSTQYHTATIVLIDTAGHRIGESEWQIEFKVHVTSEGT